MLCSQMWNTKLQTDKSKFVCWLERMVRGRGFWWPRLGLITVTVSDLLYFVLAQFKSVLITVTLTRESKTMFNLKYKWCSICCMFCVDVSPPFVQEHKRIDPSINSSLCIHLDSQSHLLWSLCYITLTWSATDLDLDLTFILLIF
jgi:hypothetical protein